MVRPGAPTGPHTAVAGSSVGVPDVVEVVEVVEVVVGPGGDLRLVHGLDGGHDHLGQLFGPDVGADDMGDPQLVEPGGSSVDARRHDPDHGEARRPQPAEHLAVEAP